MTIIKLLTRAAFELPRRAAYDILDGVGNILSFKTAGMVQYFSLKPGNYELKARDRSISTEISSILSHQNLISRHC